VRVGNYRSKAGLKGPNKIERLKTRDRNIYKIKILLFCLGWDMHGPACKLTLLS
jgi:hypothetical protein